MQELVCGEMYFEKKAKTHFFTLRPLVKKDFKMKKDEKTLPPREPQVRFSLCCATFT